MHEFASIFYYTLGLFAGLAVVAAAIFIFTAIYCKVEDEFERRKRLNGKR